MKNEEIIKKIKREGTKKVKVAITDLDGVLRGKYIHQNKFLSSSSSGLGFCNVVFGWDSADLCYDNVDYTGWHTGYPDALANIDLNTYRKIPWDDQTPFFLADFTDQNNKPLFICPRQLLKKQIQKAKDMGFSSQIGLEYEWFNFLETPHSLAEKGYQTPTPLTPGMFGYSLLRAGYHRDYFKAIFDELLEFKVPIEGIHTETGPGVYEAAIMAADPLEAADRGILFKTSVKEIAYRFRILPSFMAKWNENLPGCSGHVHQSLLDARSGKNVFFDNKDTRKMSRIFRQYLAGQIHCIPEILPFFVPNINSYKRLVEGLWAPTRVTWGVENRTSAFRVIPGSQKTTRLETRIAGSDANPYLVVAACLASGLYGIEKKLELKEAPVSGNAYEKRGALPLPKNLPESSEKMLSSELAQKLFGGNFIEHFYNTRVWECRQYQKAVTDWEIRRYFELA